MKLFILLFSWALAQGTFDTKLIQAVNEESLTQVKKLAKDKKLLNRKDKVGHDPLYHAVSLNNSDIVKALLNAGASTTENYNNAQESILFEATRLGSVEIVEILLKKNKDLLDLKNSQKESVLFEAVRSNHSRLAEFYLQKGLSLQVKNRSGKTPVDFLDSTNEKMAAVLKKSSAK